MSTANSKTCCAATSRLLPSDFPGSGNLATDCRPAGSSVIGLRHAACGEPPTSGRRSGHHPRVLRIDPAARPIWRTPDSLQFGLDPVLAILDPVPAGADRVVHALAAGCDRATLEALVGAGGLDQLDSLLTTIAPALLRRSTAAAVPLGVAITGPDDLVELLRGWFPAASARPDVAVVVAHHLVPPAGTVRWLRDDVPHLAVVFGDQSATVGPLVVPGATPCLQCADQHRLDGPHWRAIAAQLLRRGGSRTAGSARIRLRVAALVGDAIESLREAAPTGLEGAALRIAPDGSVSRSPRPWHERCLCRHPDAPAGAAPSGTGTAAAPPAAAPVIAPTTAVAGPAPA